MDHAACQDLLLDLVYGELEPLRAAEVELHLAGCAECQAARARIDGTRALFAPLVSPGIAGSIEQPGENFDGPILAAARGTALAAARRDPMGLMGERDREARESESRGEARGQAQAHRAAPAPRSPVLADPSAAVRDSVSSTSAPQSAKSAMADLSNPSGSAAANASSLAAARGRRRPLWMRAAVACSVAAAAALALVVSNGRNAEKAVQDGAERAAAQPSIAANPEQQEKNAMFAPPPAAKPAAPADLAESRAARLAPAEDAKERLRAPASPASIEAPSAEPVAPRDLDKRMQAASDLAPLQQPEVAKAEKQQLHQAPHAKKKDARSGESLEEDDETVLSLGGSGKGLAGAGAGPGGGGTGRDRGLGNAGPLAGGVLQGHSESEGFVASPAKSAVAPRRFAAPPSQLAQDSAPQATAAPPVPSAAAPAAPSVDAPAAQAQTREQFAQPPPARRSLEPLAAAPPPPPAASPATAPPDAPAPIDESSPAPAESRPAAPRAVAHAASPSSAAARIDSSSNGVAVDSGSGYAGKSGLGSISVAGDSSSSAVATATASGRGVSASDPSAVEARAVDARSRGLFAQAARLFQMAARLRRRDSAPDTAARDLAQAVSCYLAAGNLNGAQSARTELAAIPAQTSALDEADREIATTRAMAAQPSAGSSPTPASTPPAVRKAAEEKTPVDADQPAGATDKSK